ncbi:hypothetical protein LEP1GSC058_3409 [Leptospira fainei serovar Hurstbridge str. BUT 6]|uniref:Uncharacterized protein n=1 Tax=Leptospira fainei serovar Hurstbridge str. BUT 6 TaxID=1193011 RepID=S3UZU4_9LEPT|nr:hypothetical protein LEP1GSC058_3409 [Leptospira fainei serovar Hurstbridge str. BUT 6]
MISCSHNDSNSDIGFNRRVSYKQLTPMANSFPSFDKTFVVFIIGIDFRHASPA